MSGGDPTRELRPDFDPDHPRGLDEWRAVEEADPQRLADLQARIAKKLADLEMATPAIIALESTKPVTFIVSQALAAGEPLLYWLAGLQDYYNFRKVMEEIDALETTALEQPTYMDYKEQFAGWLAAGLSLLLAAAIIENSVLQVVP